MNIKSWVVATPGVRTRRQSVPKEDLNPERISREMGFAVGMTVVTREGRGVIKTMCQGTIYCPRLLVKLDQGYEQSMMSKRVSLPEEPSPGVLLRASLYNIEIGSLIPHGGKQGHVLTVTNFLVNGSPMVVVFVGRNKLVLKSIDTAIVLSEYLPVKALGEPARIPNGYQVGNIVLTRGVQVIISQITPKIVGLRSDSEEVSIDARYSRVIRRWI